MFSLSRLQNKSPERSVADYFGYFFQKISSADTDKLNNNLTITKKWEIIYTKKKAQNDTKTELRTNVLARDKKNTKLTQPEVKLTQRLDRYILL